MVYDGKYIFLRKHRHPKINKTHFGQGDDASKPDRGIYYVRKGNYPFAFFLSRATESDLSKLLDGNNERKSYKSVI